MPNPTPYKRSRLHTWSPQQLEILEKLYPNTNNKTIAATLNKTDKAIRTKANTLGYKKIIWTAESEVWLLANFKLMDDKELMEQIHQKFGLIKTNYAVINKYRELAGLRGKYEAK